MIVIGVWVLLFGLPIIYVLQKRNWGEIFFGGPVVRSIEGSVAVSTSIWRGAIKVYVFEASPSVYQIGLTLKVALRTRVLLVLARREARSLALVIVEALAGHSNCFTTLLGVEVRASQIASDGSAGVSLETHEILTLPIRLGLRDQEARRLVAMIDDALSSASGSLGGDPQIPA
jgi:hypothetical protein